MPALSAAALALFFAKTFKTFMLYPPKVRSGFKGALMASVAGQSKPHDRRQDSRDRNRRARYGPHGPSRSRLGEGRWCVSVSRNRWLNPIDPDGA
jgi:hypothetical protein